MASRHSRSEPTHPIPNEHPTGATLNHRTICAAAGHGPERGIAPRLACVCAVIALAGCGGSSHSTPSKPSTQRLPAATATPTATATPPAGPVTNVALDAEPSGRFAFVQKSLTAKPGTVTITFANKSPVPHDLVILQAGKRFGATPVFNGGSKTLTVGLVKGVYLYFCSVAGHQQAGMEGTLVVK